MLLASFSGQQHYHLQFIIASGRSTTWLSPRNVFTANFLILEFSLSLVYAYENECLYPGIPDISILHVWLDGMRPEPAAAEAFRHAGIAWLAGRIAGRHGAKSQNARHTGCGQHQGDATSSIHSGRCWRAIRCHD